MIIDYLQNLSAIAIYELASFVLTAIRNFNQLQKYKINSIYCLFKLRIYILERKNEYTTKIRKEKSYEWFYKCTFVMSI